MASERYTQEDRGMPVVAIPRTLGRYFTEADLDHYVAERCAPLVEALRKIALWSAPNGRDAGFLEQRQFASAALRAHREGGERGE